VFILLTACFFVNVIQHLIYKINLLRVKKQTTAAELTDMKKPVLKFLPVLFMALMAAGCENSGSRNPTTADTSGYYQTGIASWYGAEYQGKATASGEAFDRKAMTAAHKVLPFDTWVQVYNLENGRKVRVRINDRGPFVEDRIIDLSEKAADELGMKIAGLAQVGIEIVSGP